MKGRQEHPFQLPAATWGLSGTAGNWRAHQGEASFQSRLLAEPGPGGRGDGTSVRTGIPPATPAWPMWMLYSCGTNGVRLLPGTSSTSSPAGR